MCKCPWVGVYRSENQGGAGKGKREGRRRAGEAGAGRSCRYEGQVGGANRRGQIRVADKERRSEVQMGETEIQIRDAGQGCMQERDVRNAGRRGRSEVQTEAILFTQIGGLWDGQLYGSCH